MPCCGIDPWLYILCMYHKQHFWNYSSSWLIAAALLPSCLYFSLLRYDACMLVCYACLPSCRAGPPCLQASTRKQGRHDEWMRSEERATRLPFNMVINTLIHWHISCHMSRRVYISEAGLREEGWLACWHGGWRCVWGLAVRRGAEWDTTHYWARLRCAAWCLPGCWLRPRRSRTRRSLLGPDESLHLN